MRKVANRIAARLKWIRAFRSIADKPMFTSVAISMVRNEQDIIEPFIRHNIKFFDLLVILDNLSTDRTREISMKIAREIEGRNDENIVIVTDVLDKGQNQSEYISSALQHVQSVAFSDYVFFLDADEFISAKNRDDLLHQLQKIRPGTIGLMPWKTYIPDPSISEIDQPDPLCRLKLQRNHEQPQYYKAILRMGGGLDPTLVVEQGSHMVRDCSGKKLPSIILDELHLTHLPLRSSEQLLAKGLIGWNANLKRKSKLKEKQTLHWRRLYEIAQAGRKPNEEDLALEALEYAQDPKVGTLSSQTTRKDHGIKVNRLYSQGDFAAADKLVADLANDSMFTRTEFKLPVPPEPIGDTTNITNEIEGNWNWDNVYLDAPPIRYLVELIEPNSVLDLGCGVGLYSALFRHLGVDKVLGIDKIEPEATILEGKTYQKANLQEKLDCGHTFDLVVCLEVLEHIRPEATGMLIDNIARHANKHILFSVASPSQPGNGHINFLSIKDAIDLWAARGWEPDLHMTLGLRALSSLSSLKQNMLFLKRSNSKNKGEAAQILADIGRFPFNWHGQLPGKRATAFTEPFPDPKYGYGLRLPRAFFDISSRLRKT